MSIYIQISMNNWHMITISFSVFLLSWKTELFMFILDILAITFHPYYCGYYNGPKKPILTRFDCIIYTAVCFSYKYTQELYFCLSAMLLKFYCAVFTVGESEVFGNIHTGVLSHFVHWTKLQSSTSFFGNLFRTDKQLISLNTVLCLESSAVTEPTHELPAFLYLF